MNLLDVHTHHPGREGAIINLAPGETPVDGLIYSAGLHPWDTALPDREIDSRLDEISRLAARREVVAIGESGLDLLRGASLDRQEAIFRRQVAISESVGKPMILHVVKAFPEIMRLRRELSPAQPWVIHGFRGKPQLAAELLREGFYISLGERFNRETAEIIPADRLFVETDESRLSVEEIAARLPYKPDGSAYSMFIQ